MNVTKVILKTSRFSKLSNGFSKLPDIRIKPIRCGINYISMKSIDDSMQSGP